MKTILSLIALFIMLNAFAVPGEMTLTAPSKITVVGKKLELEFKLSCGHDSALDWSQIVMSSDDAGDMAAAVGLVYSKSHSSCGQINGLKTFTMVVVPAEYGYSTTETMEFVPMDVAR